MNNKLTHLVEQVRELQKKMQIDGQSALKEAFAEFFEAHPEAKSILWAQYTPYFNDGEACEFSVSDFELRVYPSMMEEDVKRLLTTDEDGEQHEDEDDDAGEDGTYGYGNEGVIGCLQWLSSNDNTYKWNPAVKRGIKLRKLTPKEKLLCDDFNELVNSCKEIEQVLELVFGDHAFIVATREGFNVSEFEHE